MREAGGSDGGDAGTARERQGQVITAARSAHDSIHQ